MSQLTPAQACEKAFNDNIAHKTKSECWQLAAQAAIEAGAMEAQKYSTPHQYLPSASDQEDFMHYSDES